MPDGQVLEFSRLTKRFGTIAAVSRLTARVEPGQVTGFLGPNGAGKTTSLRILLGLVRASEGTATIGGSAYRSLANPLQTVGAVLEASSFHPGRSGANHLLVYARAAGLPKKRVDEVLGLVGLSDAAGRSAGGYSLGMRQRLGLATALLGDPGVLVLDEPTNGLDPEGIKWIRGFLRQLAREGRTVLVSSHLLAEVQQTVDALVMISRGRLVFQGRLDELTDPAEYTTVVDAPDRAALTDALRSANVSFDVLRSGLTVSGLDGSQVGQVAANAGIALSSLHRRGPALEEVFLELANGTRTHPSADGTVATGEAEERSAGTEPPPAPEGEVAPEPEPEPEPEAEAEADPEPEPERESAPEPERESAPEPEPERESAPDPEPERESAPEPELEPESDLDPPEPSDDDRPWEDYVRTDADEEADAFFSSFDDAGRLSRNDEGEATR
ncbi:ATP-binding cassette domain-containing protein [Microbacterium marmarense]|uniref:ATP-binding cassette domain-containing protein n=1 Tax=Microbacterium marmarense TaxID=3122051 RepID=A0ABU8LP58_9MICO